MDLRDIFREDWQWAIEQVIKFWSPWIKVRYTLPSLLPHPRQRRNGPFCCMTHWNVLAANNVMQQQTGPFCYCGGGLISAVCVWFIFGKTSLALVICVLLLPLELVALIIVLSTCKL